MTISQAKNFYGQDTKSYEIKKNKKFLTWLKNITDNGYNCFMYTEELQELIDNIVNWYEFKYPERELEQLEGIRDLKFQDFESISDVMDIRQLLLRLPQNQLCLIECKYRARCGGLLEVHENNQVKQIHQILLKINKKEDKKSDCLEGSIPYIYLFTDAVTGILSEGDVKKYIGDKENINLDELLTIFKEKYIDELDFTELQESVNNHNLDVELRNKILQLTALKLLYSKNTTPERGYIRARRFIEEFNEELNLTLSTEEIDKAFSGEYSTRKGFADAKKTYENKEVDKEQKHGIKRFLQRKKSKKSF